MLLSRRQLLQASVGLLATAACTDITHVRPNVKTLGTKEVGMTKEEVDALYDLSRPRKLLALDGGGIRGALTLEVLVKMEAMLAKATGKGKDFRLCQFFDYIGGTSTGAIIATALARGMAATEVLQFYKQAGPDMFDKAWLLARLRHLYETKPLAGQLQTVFGKDTTLEPQHLKSLLLVVTRNVTTDSPWPISSNPRAKYNESSRPDCNLKIPLWQLVRASTAAPIFFEPEVIQWDLTNPAKRFVFVDGGMTPYNNPAFLLYRMATLPEYKLGWKTGEKNLLLVSIGTGAAPEVDAEVYSPGKNALSNLAGIPSALMYGASVDQDLNCRTVGRCVYGAPLDRELGDLIPRDAGGNAISLSQDLGRSFLYARYNAELSFDGLRKMGLSNIDPKKVSKLDSVDALEDLSRVGQNLAEEVKLEHFGSFV